MGLAEPSGQKARSGQAMQPASPDSAGRCVPSGQGGHSTGLPHPVEYAPAAQARHAREASILL